MQGGKLKSKGGDSKILKIKLYILKIRGVPEVFPAPAPAGKRAFLVLRLRPENGYFVAGKNLNFFNEVFLYFN